jgi:hypothetical protein
VGFELEEEEVPRGRTLTGIMTTFLKEERKSRLSAWRLTLAMKKASVEASCSES